MIVAVPWRKNEDDKLEREEHVPVPKIAHMTREDLELFGFTAECLGCTSLLKGRRGQAHTEN